MKNSLSEFLINLRRKYRKISEEEFCNMAANIIRGGISEYPNSNIRVIRKGKKYIIVMPVEDV